MSDYVYDAFISYSHSDLQHAGWLQKKLEKYRIPKGLLPEEAGARNFRIFRDQTDLAGVELQESLRKELDVSKFLIVICSPKSAASVWVNEEVEYFRSLKRGNRIIPFVVEGEPESDKPELECYPPSLRVVAGKHMLGVNIQEIGKNKAFLKLVSIMLDIRFNRLVDREKLRKRRRITLTSVIAGGAAAVLIGLLAHNASISKRNHELSYDIYYATMAETFQMGASLEDNVKAIDTGYLKASAQEGNSDAMILLASCYMNGYGDVEVDQEKAFYWLLKSAEAGDPYGMVAAGNCYRFGEGTSADQEKAFEWYLKAGETGDPSGMLNLGYAYELGVGTKSDPEKAFYWYSKAAETGNEDAMMCVAMCYRDGIGVEQDWEKAFEWNNKLAGMGNATAMYNTALLYQYGKGTEEDPEKAYYWYRKAAEAGEGQAAYMVGWCTENKYGTKDAALEWYRRAAELGWEKAESDIERLGG